MATKAKVRQLQECTADWPLLDLVGLERVPEASHRALRVPPNLCCSSLLHLHLFADRPDETMDMKLERMVRRVARRSRCRCVGENCLDREDWGTKMTMMRMEAGPAVVLAAGWRPVHPSSRIRLQLKLLLLRNLLQLEAGTAHLNILAVTINTSCPNRRNREADLSGRKVTEAV